MKMGLRDFFQKNSHLRYAKVKDVSPFCILLYTNILLIFGWVDSQCQVINDNIENRLELKTNEPFQSNTTGCTLQWGCLNHALTKKLIQYHNDQWFFFKTADSDKYFINISSQDCRDLRGVQIMLILGEACKPDSYEILDCISLGNQDDVFLKLDNLSPDQEYLVLIDGYLHDNCAFEIELSETPKGLPVDDVGLVRMKSKALLDFHIEIYWSVPDTIANLVRRYEVYRRFDFDFKSELIHEVAQGFNARGLARLDYVCEDILPDYGVLHYKIVGVGDHDRLLIAKSLTQISRPSRSITELKNWIDVDLHYSKACQLKISVFDASSQYLLISRNFSYNNNHRLFSLNIEEYRKQGVFSYRVEVVNTATKEKKSHLRLK